MRRRRSSAVWPLPIQTSSQGTTWEELLSRTTVTSTRSANVFCGQARRFEFSLEIVRGPLDYLTQCYFSGKAAVSLANSPVISPVPKPMVTWRLKDKTRPQCDTERVPDTPKHHLVHVAACLLSIVPFVHDATVGIDWQGRRRCSPCIRLENYSGKVRKRR